MSKKDKRIDELQSAVARLLVEVFPTRKDKVGRWVQEELKQSKIRLIKFPVIFIR